MSTGENGTESRATNNKFYSTEAEAREAGTPNPKFDLYEVTGPDGESVGFTWQRGYLYALYASAAVAGYKAGKAGGGKFGGGRAPVKSAEKIAQRMATDPAFKKLIEEQAALIAGGGVAKPAPKGTAATAPKAAPKPTGKPKQLQSSK